jgi:pSer/pThr/pTyr-binding forkhead associated (FHA) protein
VRTVPSFAWAAGAALALALGLLARRMWAGHVVVEPAPAPPPPPGVPTVVFNKPPASPPPQTPRRSGTQVGFAWPAPQPGRPVAILRGVSGTMRGEQFAMDKPVFHVGCAPDNDLVLVGDDFASGHHAILRAQAHALYAEDLGSLNGSYLNGVPFKSATRALSPGDELRFGHTTLEVASAEAAAHHAHSGLEPRVK